MLNIIDSIKESCIEISNLIHNSNSIELAKMSTKYNLSGDDVKKLDILANNILKDNLSKIPDIKCMGSEEDNDIIFVNNNGNYMVCFDPLDGSSNIDVNITTGTIFVIFEFKGNKILNGRDIVSAGYCLYGGSTQLVIANDNSVKMHHLINNKFSLINDNLKVRNMGSIYAINECNKYIWNDSRYAKLTDNLISKNYTARWVASLVADAHRTIIKGGFFSYPGNKKYPEGRIRLLYEAYPFAYIFEKAGGFSSNGHINLLDIDFPENIHQKTSIILSSKFEFDLFNEL